MSSSITGRDLMNGRQLPPPSASPLSPFLPGRSDKRTGFKTCFFFPFHSSILEGAEHGWTSTMLRCAPGLGAQTATCQIPYPTLLLLQPAGPEPNQHPGISAHKLRPAELRQRSPFGGRKTIWISQFTTGAGIPAQAGSHWLSLCFL